MARLDTLFDDARSRGRRVLVTYLCVGDPDVETSLAVARACIDGGADVLELGTPFSDPTADGPVIARASHRALGRGGGLDRTLDVAARLRAESETPLVLFGYYNPLFVRGEARAVELAHRAGVDALLVVDLPLEEGRSLRARAEELGVAVVPLVTPTSTEARLALVRADARRGGFAYYVSVAGVTGSARAPLADASLRAAAVRRSTGLPTVVGFGIDGPAAARTAGAHADGIVVGTAIVRLVEEATSAAAAASAVLALVRSLRAALDELPPPE